jgi:hypothetical protein
LHRRNGGAEYAIACRLEDVVNLLRDFHFEDGDLSYLPRYCGLRIVCRRAAALSLPLNSTRIASPALSERVPTRAIEEMKTAGVTVIQIELLMSL